MKRLAIFVEGLTEQILVRNMLEKVMDRKEVAIQTVKLTGGHSRRITFTVMRAAKVTRQTGYYVLIYDCGGETNVKGYLMTQRESLVNKGYDYILGLRDVFPNFTREEIQKLQHGLNMYLSQKAARTEIFLAVMETEAWFLGEHTHFRKVDPRLTPEYIEEKLGFNPRTENMESREAPAHDLKMAYRLAGHDYTKKRNRLNHMVKLLNFRYFTTSLAHKMESLGAFVDCLEEFFE